MEILAVVIYSLFWFGIVFFMGFMWWRIMQKTGYHGALGILMLVPIANIIMMAILAFKDWPIHKEIRVRETNPSSSLPAPLIIVIVLAVGIPVLGLLAAIAIPNFLRARANANETIAEQTIKKISAEIENYAVRNNGEYPVNEAQLKPYLSDSYNDKIINGYHYNLDLHSNSYEVLATPEKCYSTGIKNFRIINGGAIYKEDCKH